MSFAQTAGVLGWLVRDTFRQSLESRVFWLLLGLSGLGILTCLSVGIDGPATLDRPGEHADFLPKGDREADPAMAKRDGVDIVDSHLTLGFGAFRIPLARDAFDAVRFLELLLAAGLAGTAGLLMAIIWTSGFMPAFLAPSSLTVLLVKPVPRALLFLGKFSGVLVFVLFQTTIFVAGTWLALGARTGIWDSAYLSLLPILWIQFAIFFTVSVLIASHNRGTAACVLGSVLFWLLCWGVNYGRHCVAALPELAPGVAKPGFFMRSAVEIGYWILPKPADFSIVLTDLLATRAQADPFPEFAAVKRMKRFHATASWVTSILSACVILGFAVRRFEVVDY